MTKLIASTTTRQAFRQLVAGIVVLVVLVVGICGWRYVGHDRSNQPLCNKRTMLEVDKWFSEKWWLPLPNVDGRSVDSFAKFKKAVDAPEIHDEEIADWNEKYQYVPGLRRDDPGDLVLMYMKEPTRWKHHATGAPSIFRERKWVLVSLDFGETLTSFSRRVQREIADESECAENVPLSELKSRLQKTLDFLREHDRPNWQTVVAENEEFLKSIDNK